MRLSALKNTHSLNFSFSGTSSTSSLGRLPGMSGILSSRDNSHSEASPGPTAVTPAGVAATNDERVRELVARLPPAPPTKMGVTTEIVTKRSFTETSVKRVTKNEPKPKIEEVVLVKAGGPLGLSIIGGSDHSCVPFGTGESGIFISKVRLIKYFQLPALPQQFLSRLLGLQIP